STSDFGGQLDSLCDLVSFGVAPAILLVKMCPQFTTLHREAIWGIAALFACCAAMRLARFNVETDETDEHVSFSGLPSPAAAAVIASFAMLSYKLRNEVNYEYFQGFDWWLQGALPPFTLVLALLMVSRIPYPHVVTRLLRGQKSFPQVVAILVVAMVVLSLWSYAVPLLFGYYAASPAIAHLWRRRRWRQARIHEGSSESVHRAG
ncbi:MAG: CDP-alcohol phosphatidyltransferase family protein, partial [Planctomycetota bacterium]